MTLNLDWDNKVNIKDNLLNEVKKWSSIVIFGAGIGGKQTFDLLASTNYVDNVVCFSDNDVSKHNTVYLKKKVLPPNQLFDFAPNALILISSTAFDIIKKQLMQYGFKDAQIYYFQPAGISIENEAHKFVKDNFLHFEKAYSMLADEKSKNIYRTLLNYRVTTNNDYLKELSVYVDDEKTQYFDKMINDYVFDGIFVDGGAYTGDTMDSFYERCVNDTNVVGGGVLCF